VPVTLNQASGPRLVRQAGGTRGATRSRVSWRRCARPTVGLPLFLTLRTTPAEQPDLQGHPTRAQTGATRTVNADSLAAQGGIDVV
jgi:hypothetical protein